MVRNTDERLKSYEATFDGPASLTAAGVMALDDNDLRIIIARGVFGWKPRWVPVSVRGQQTGRYALWAQEQGRTSVFKVPDWPGFDGAQQIVDRFFTASSGTFELNGAKIGGELHYQCRFGICAWMIADNPNRAICRAAVAYLNRIVGSEV